MYKIVIADDEPTEIKFIRYVINTFKLPLCICGEAENGEEAINLVNEHSPEFVILDIHMPLMDGLSAASIIKRDHPSTNVYLLTAFELFEYAQKAVRADVDDYLLKPIKPEVLADVLKKGIEAASKQRLAHHQMNNTQENIEKMKPLLKRQVMLDLITAGRTDSIPANLKSVLGLSTLDFKGILVATFCDKKGEILTEEGLRDLLAKGIEDNSGFGLCEILPSGDVVGFVEVWDEKTQQVQTKTIETYKHDQEIKIYAGLVPINEQSDIPSAFDSADKLRKTALFWRVPGIFLLAQLGSVQDYLPSVLSVEKTVLNRLLERRVDKAQEEIKEAFSNVSDRFISPEQVIAVANQIVNAILMALSEQFIPEKEARLITQQYLERIAAVRSYGELEYILFELIESVNRFLCLENETQTEQSIKWAAAYIRQNYQEDITLDQIASKLFLSPSYFSRMFKKNVGESFASYVIRVRMEHAQSLLATGKFSVTQVAKKVGFENSGYFSTVYKKHFGMSPQQSISAIASQEAKYRDKEILAGVKL
ncbi:MAG: response regulator [Desulfitobacterium hafniense]|nr:response regulator [Desulfitobacterium hafniense]